MILPLRFGHMVPPELGRNQSFFWNQFGLSFFIDATRCQGITCAITIDSGCSSVFSGIIQIRMSLST